MSLLLALDYADEAKRRIRNLCAMIERMVEEEVTRGELTDLCHRVHDVIDSTALSLEQTLLPEGTSVAVTYYPFRVREESASEKKTTDAVEASDISERSPRRAGDLRGTVFYPRAEDEGPSFDQ